MFDCSSSAALGSGVTPGVSGTAVFGGCAFVATPAVDTSLGGGVTDVVVLAAVLAGVASLSETLLVGKVVPGIPAVIPAAKYNDLLC